MTSPKNLLLIEDSDLQGASLTQDLKNSNWQIIRATDKYSALSEYDRWHKNTPTIDAIALDLGLPPGVDNPIRGGLPLAENIRERNANIPILAYTSLQPQAINYSFLTARLLALRISFVYLRRLGGGIRFTHLLDLTWQGFVILSPGPADVLPRAIPHKPDPLNADLWETLRLLNDNLLNKEIAHKMGDNSADAVKYRLAKTRDILHDTFELEIHEGNREDLSRWYRQNHVRYCRS